MILQCNVHCWDITPEEEEDLNIKDPGLWVKSAFDLSTVKAIKQAVPDITDTLYYCTTIYLAGGDSFTIDVPFDTVFDLWQKALGKPVTLHSDRDLEL